MFVYRGGDGIVRPPARQDSEKEWVEEAELTDSSPLGTSRNWRAVTIAASTRLATRIVAEEVERSF